MRKFSKKIGLEAEIYLKFEGCNPTGSFKDRGMAMLADGILLLVEFLIDVTSTAITGEAPKQ